MDMGLCIVKYAFCVFQKRWFGILFLRSAFTGNQTVTSCFVISLLSTIEPPDCCYLSKKVATDFVKCTHRSTVTTFSG